MRLFWINWTSAIILSACLGTAVVVAGENGEKADAPVEIGTLAGAFLAARTAETDNDVESAIRYYSRALSFDPENQALQQNLMLAMIAGGRFDDALPLAKKLKTVADVERYSRLALGVASLKTREYRAAENWLKLAEESDLDRLITGILTGWARTGAGKAGEAIDHVKALDGPIWYDLFKGFHVALIADVAGRPDAGKFYQAVIDDRAAINASPDTWMHAVEAYAVWLARQGRGDEALAILDTGDEVSPDRPAVVALRKKIRSATRIQPYVASVQQGAAELLLNLGMALNRGGGEAFVRLYLQYARALDPKNGMILFELGSVSEQMGKADRAIEYYRQVPADSPLRRLSELQLGLNLADLDRYEEAVDHLKSALGSDPDDMRAYLALGGVYSSKEDYGSAAELYDSAAARLKLARGEDWNIFYQRGIAYERLKQWEKAEPNFKRALELYPDQPQVLNYLGYSWVDMGINLEEGLDMIRKAVDLRPQDGYIVDSLGWAYYRLGRMDEALVEMERAVNLRPDDPTINDHLGDVYWRIGRRLEATYQWSHAKDLNPEPALLEQIEKKLKSGLPPVEDDDALAKPTASQGQPKG